MVHYTWNKTTLKHFLFSIKYAIEPGMLCCHAYKTSHALSECTRPQRRNMCQGTLYATTNIWYLLCKHTVGRVLNPVGCSEPKTWSKFSTPNWKNEEPLSKAGITFVLRVLLCILHRHEKPPFTRHSLIFLKVHARPQHGYCYSNQKTGEKQSLVPRGGGGKLKLTLKACPNKEYDSLCSGRFQRGYRRINWVAVRMAFVLYIDVSPLYVRSNRWRNLGSCFQGRRGTSGHPNFPFDPVDYSLSNCTCSTLLIHWKLSSSVESGLCSATITILSSWRTLTENTAILWGVQTRTDNCVRIPSAEKTVFHYPLWLITH